MAESIDVATFVGSLRRESYTRKLVHNLQRLAPAALKLDIVEIGDLGFYNQDEEASPPAEWLALRERIRRANAVLFATPEYNRSVPAVLKNAVDIGSRPQPHNAWAGKPGAVISVSPGAMGGFGANQHLRQSLVAVNVQTMTGPEAYIGGIASLLDGEGHIAAPESREFLTRFLASFEAWIRRF
jgi:chromate reductase, NAD(P)H dehydrogenase (quinone)